MKSSSYVLENLLGNVLCKHEIVYLFVVFLFHFFLVSLSGEEVEKEMSYQEVNI